MLENYISPRLRLVQGSAFSRQDKDKAGKPYKKDDGTPYTKGFIAVAGKKGDPEVEAMRKSIMDQGPIECAPFFLNGVLNPPTRKFSYKIIDGDGVDDDGLPNSTKEGFAGHWVFRMSTMYEIKAFPTGKYGIPDQLIQQPGGPEPFSRGCYVRVVFTVKGNNSADKPGLAIYPSHVEFLDAGTPITSGPSAAALFGAKPSGAAGGPTYIMQASAGGVTREAYHASGWTDAQLITAGHMVVQAPAAAPAAPPAAPAAPAAPPPAPAAPVAVAPHPGILAPAAGPTYIMQASAGGITREAYHASGWTDAQLITAGHMVVQAPAAAPAAPPAAPAAPAAPPPAPAAPLPPGGSAPTPPPPAATAVAAAAPGYKMADPNGTTYAAYIAANWTDAQLIQNQIMVPL